MQRQPPSQSRGLPAIFSIAQQSNNSNALPPTVLRTLQVKAERTKTSLDALIGYIGFDHANNHVKNMGVWQELLALYQAILIQIQELSTFISDPPVRSSSSSTTESVNPFLTSVVHLQVPINADQESLDRLEYMVLPSRLAVTREAEIELIAQQGEVSGWKKDEQIAAMMPQDLAEEQEGINDELLEMRRRMRKAGDIVHELTTGLDWKMRATAEVEEEDEPELEEPELEPEPKMKAKGTREDKQPDELGGAPIGENQSQTQATVPPPIQHNDSEDDEFEILDPQTFKGGEATAVNASDGQLSRVQSIGSAGTADSLFGDSMDVDTPASQARPGHASNVIDISMDDVDDDSDDENDMEAVGM